MKNQEKQKRASKVIAKMRKRYTVYYIVQFEGDSNEKIAFLPAFLARSYLAFISRFNR